jgi:hypothetical protein
MKHSLQKLVAFSSLVALKILIVFSLDLVGLIQKAKKNFLPLS